MATLKKSVSEKLLTIFKNGGEYTVKALSSKTGSTAQTIAANLEKIEAEGFKLVKSKKREGERGPASTTYASA